MHLELDELRLRLDLLQNVELLLGYDVNPIHAQVRKDGDARQRRHKIPAHRRLQHFQHLIIMRLLIQSHTA